MSPEPRRKAKAVATSSEYRLMFTVTLALVALGVVMVFSASSTTQILRDGGLVASVSFLKKTMIAVVIGFVALALAMRIRLTRVRELTPQIGLVCLILLFAVLVVGARVNGTKGWFFFGPIQMQPVEFFKLALVLYGANLLADRPDRLHSIREMGPYLGFAGLGLGLVLLQPDMGSAMIGGFAVAVTLIAAGAKMRDIYLLGGVLGGLALVYALMEPYRRARIFTFLNPNADPTGAGFQTIQAKLSIGSGGIDGIGLGDGVQKAFYLPEAHTDMISAVIGEEFGLLGLLVVIALFGLFALAGFRIAMNARDAYGRILAAGLTSLIVIQACLNLYAVMGWAPLTGVPLPLVSYGNNSMVVTLVAIGLILNVARGGRAATVQRSPAKGRGRPGAARLRAIDGAQQNPNRRRTATSERSRRDDGRDRRRRHGGTRGPGTGHRRRAS